MSSASNCRGEIMEIRGTENTIKYSIRLHGKEQNLADALCEIALEAAMFFSPSWSESSVKSAVVRGTVRIAYGNVYQRRA